MRLVGTIIVALLAVSLAIFPLAMPQAATLAGHDVAVAEISGQTRTSIDDGHTHAGTAVACDASAPSACAEGATSHAATDPGCCSMGACHAFQASAPPSLSSPAYSLIPMVAAGDQQVMSRASDGIERPPRTI